MVFEKAEMKDRICLGILFAFVFLGCGALTGFPGFYECKYPPMLYYCAYGSAWSIFLYLLSEPVRLRGTAEKIVTWCSVHTMDIFMWHIFAFYLLEWINPAYMDRPWLDFAVFLGVGILGAFLQERASLVWKKRSA